MDSQLQALITAMPLSLRTNLKGKFLVGCKVPIMLPRPSLS